ncbi:DUF4178 domain-containing protein [Aquabacterium sp.]|uniref:DUF4178 domain-containing protein n=1 Tax=Aquabacterium sp. TaxID=1872578 RepID=UPI0025C6AD5D|nr:DUF4178 domain-containing protein [Aquabacterium sp.]
MAVCSFCKSTLVRDGESLRRIGQSAELFDDHSPLALGARGQYQGESFTLVGRVQLAYQDDDGLEGRWTEWHALFDNGRSGSLSEDNGAYVFGFGLPTPAPTLPDLLRPEVGSTQLVAQQPWVLSSRVQVHVHAAQGELAEATDLKSTYPVVELRNMAGEVLSVELLAAAPVLSVGRSVQLSELKLSGLSDAQQPSESKLQAKGIECPSCGSSLTPTLDSTKSIVCGSCKAVVDISKGLGGDLKYYRQDNTLEPLIPIGAVGRVKVDGRVDDWQVLGYQERCDQPSDPDEEQTFWREYLLYNRLAGFAFLVDAEDGWSVVRTVSGVPSMRGDSLTYNGITYRKLFTYPAKTTYVLGEFYWPVRKNQRTLNSDFAGTGNSTHLRLNREKSGHEITWSAGENLTAQEVISAFRIPQNQLGAFKREASLLSGIKLGDWGRTVFWILILLFVIILMTRCTDDCSDVRDTYGESSAEYQQCRSYRSSSGSHGSSYGGYSSGGSHK